MSAVEPQAGVAVAASGAAADTAAHAGNLAVYLREAAKRIDEACVRCGRCVEVCPVRPLSALKDADPVATVANVLDALVRDARLDDGAAGWIRSCNSCGICIDECPEKINPRRMLTLSTTKLASEGTKTPELFKRMSRSIKLMLAMQVIPEEFKRLFIPEPRRSVPFVFYAGCNPLKTPHLLFNTMMVLDALGIDYAFAGGPSACCGVIAAKWEGQIEQGGRVAQSVMRRFDKFEPQRVLNWCPTCEIHLGETLGGFTESGFQFDHVTNLLVERLDAGELCFTHPLPRRVVLHGHVGSGAQVTNNVARLLGAIPKLEVVEILWEQAYTCGASGCAKTPELAKREHAGQVEAAQRHGVDAFVTLYHGCHQAILSAAKGLGLDVLNFTDLLVEAMGATPHADANKTLRALDDWALVAETAGPWLKANGVDIDADFLRENGAEIFSAAEFRGGLACLGGEAKFGVSRAGGPRRQAQASTPSADS
ncbi:MAG: (Fe-S)-binding protein [Burkholderiales bacterium]|nr:(Fe-S)-binding protein [Burkholderiales bacterium]